MNPAMLAHTQWECKYHTLGIVGKIPLDIQQTLRCVIDLVCTQLDFKSTPLTVRQFDYTNLTDLATTT